jgi:hypothetical protein
MQGGHGQQGTQGPDGQTIGDASDDAAGVRSK